MLFARTGPGLASTSAAAARHLHRRPETLGCPVGGFALAGSSARAGTPAAPQFAGSGSKRERAAMAGDGPSPASPPPGCRFHPRCPLAFDRCREERPERTMNSLDGPCHMSCRSGDG
ncbi:oligopeptide/dipeptide ABC transporter ATP-binding protein [Jiella marina]